MEAMAWAARRARGRAERLPDAAKVDIDIDLHRHIHYASTVEMVYAAIRRILRRRAGRQKGKR
jgi:hypothetical protein